MISIPIIFGQLRFHRKEQIGYDAKPILVIHFCRADWLSKYVNLYSKRLFLWMPKKAKFTAGQQDDWDPWHSV